MASSIIHLAVAKELENYLGVKNKYDYYLGAIAPDLAKQIDISRIDSHFIHNTFNNNIPNLKTFLNKYPYFRQNAYDLGYFIHLYTDKEWYDGFINDLATDKSIKLLDGTILETTPDEIAQLIYADYTNLNIKLIEEYDLDLSIFYEEFKEPHGTITEIPTNKLDILINKMGILIENSQENKSYTFDIKIIKEFIRKTVSDIKKELIQ